MEEYGSRGALPMDESAPNTIFDEAEFGPIRATSPVSVWSDL